MRANRRGSTLNTVVLSLPVLIGSVAMGVDWGQVAVARVQAQAAADEGALAAVTALSDRPDSASEIAAARSLGESRADEYVGMMMVNNIVPEVETVTLGWYDDGVWSTTWPDGTAPNAVEVIATARVETSFARIFGIDGVVVRSKARAGANIVPKRAPDLVIVQDVTPSMSSTDIARAKTANAALVECIETYSTPDTRGAYVKFSNVDKTIVSMVSYGDAPGTLYNAAAGVTSGSYTNSDVCLGSGGCTNHSSGMYAGVSILNGVSAPPEDVGQAIIFITDGAPYSGGNECTTTVYNSSGSTPYKTWLKNKCTGTGGLSTLTTSTTCQNAGGKWDSTLTPRCRSTDNGAENTSWMAPGKCSKTAYTTEARCEGNDGIWQRTASTTPNPSALTQWVESTKAMAAAGTHGSIDVYAVFYSDGFTATYKNDNLKFLQKHVIRGKGADLGVLDAPTGTALTEALQDICLSYVDSGVGLIE